MLLFQLYVPRQKNLQKSKAAYDLSKGDYEGLRKFVDQTVEQNFDQINDVEQLWTLIRDTLKQGMDDYIPKGNSNSQKRLKPLWLTKSVSKSVKKKK